MSLNVIANAPPTTEDGAAREVLFSGIVCSVLLLVTVGVYWPACANGFVNWDDQSYVYEQSHVLRGINWDGLCWALTANVVGHWHPLTLMSLQLDAQLFGPEPFGFHRTAVILHALNSALAFLTVWALTGCRWRSVICGFLFALHPLRVESVAWISERKDLLSGSFFFLTVLAYVGYVRRPTIVRYLPVLTFHVVGLSAKTILVTTPCVLLLLDYWPLGRCRGFGRNDWPTWLRLISEKLPLLALSLIASILNFAYQHDAIFGFDELSAANRFVNAVESYVAYLSQSIWPAGLSPLYQVTDGKVVGTRFWSAAAVLIALTAYAVWQRRSRPYLLVGWLWFVGMLVPVSGLFQTGLQARADRYMYLSQLGIILAIIWCVADLVERTKAWRIVMSMVAAMFIVGFACKTTSQIPIWRDSESMWVATLRVDPTTPLAIRQLTAIYGLQGRFDQAVNVVHEALNYCDPADFKKLVRYTTLLEHYGDAAGAVAALNKILAVQRDQAELFNNRGKALAMLGEWQLAADDFREAAKLAPKRALFHFLLAHALTKSGDLKSGEDAYAMAIRQFPDGPQNAIHQSWKMSTNPQAEPQIRFWAVHLAELANEATGMTRPEFLDGLAAAYADAGKFDDAIRVADAAIQAAVEKGKMTIADQVRQRQELYRSGKPYREVTRQLQPLRGQL